MAWAQLRLPQTFRLDVYGTVLLAKLVLALGALASAAFAVGAMHQPRAWRVELALLSGVLALTALLVSLPPPA
ncbi:MAG: hypothetical protein LC737_03360, partial [Chloroflexi bacterium]|nr:hypothetical protein [Chloroflexota bacterium]